jgi:hypothetical protein
MSNNIQLRRRRSTVAILMATGLGIGLLSSCESKKSVTLAKSEAKDVAARGQTVMGFNLDRSTHRFIKNGYGGIEQVVADDPADSKTIEAIRAHVSGVAEAFQNGDFSSPAAIHGDSMPGLSVLRAAGSKLEVTYRELPEGSEITYRSNDRVVIDGIGLWFDAQLSDHGHHAEAK